MDGVIIIDKPQGKSSHAIVQQIKKYTGEKVGHTGTLDPLATGVLPILIGAGTKISKYFIEHDKTYEVLLQLGKRTTTGDTEGEVIETKEIPVLQEADINKILQNRIGKQTQIPPIYSAIKVQGKKLYEYARKGQTVEIPTREIEIYGIHLQNYHKEKQQIAFTVDCSKGTYIRTLCEDIAKDLQTVGYMYALRRTRVGTFTLENAITIDQITQLEQHLYTIETLFENAPAYTLSDDKVTLVQNGVSLTVSLPEGVVRLYTEHKDFLGLGTVEKGKLKRDIWVE